MSWWWAQGFTLNFLSDDEESPPIDTVTGPSEMVGVAMGFSRE